MVKAQYRVIDGVMLFAGSAMKLGHVSRTMCIDAARKLILTDRIEAEMDEGDGGDHFEQSVTYERIERNPTLQPGTFEFRPPAGAKERVRPAHRPRPCRRLRNRQGPRTTEHNQR